MYRCGLCGTDLEAAQSSSAASQQLCHQLSGCRFLLSNQAKKSGAYFFKCGANKGIMMIEAAPVTALRQ